MEITRFTRSVRKSSQLAGSHVGGAPFMEGFLKPLALRGRDPAVADENLYRYCENGPTDGVDPSGLASVDGTVEGWGKVHADFDRVPIYFESS